MANIISFINLKGGVGKTSSALNVGAILAARGERVLMVDLDSQANLTGRCVYFDKGTENVMFIQDALLSVAFGKRFSISALEVKRNLHLIPSSLDLAGIETKMAFLVNSERPNVLKKFLAKITNEYDWIILDCPPGAGLITINIVVSSDRIYVPCLLEDDSFNGLVSLMKVVKMASPNQHVPISIFFNKYDLRTKLAFSVNVNFRKYFSHYLMNSHIRNNNAISMAAREHMGALEYDKQCHAAHDYNILVDEIKIHFVR